MIIVIHHIIGLSLTLVLGTAVGPFLKNLHNRMKVPPIDRRRSQLRSLEKAAPTPSG